MNHEKQIDNLLNNARELVSELHDKSNPDLQRLRDRFDKFTSRRADRKSPGAVQHSL